MNDITAVVGVDIAKHVFQLHEVSKETGKIISVQLKRKTFLAHFANRSTCLIGMEACGGAQHWARKLIALGHVVRLLAVALSWLWIYLTGQRSARFITRSGAEIEAPAVPNNER